MLGGLDSGTLITDGNDDPQNLVMSLPTFMINYSDCFLNLKFFIFRASSKNTPNHLKILNISFDRDLKSCKASRCQESTPLPVAPLRRRLVCQQTCPAGHLAACQPAAQDPP